MPDNVSPEEKLFKIIQNGKNAPPGEQNPPDVKKKRPAGGLKELFKMDFKIKAPRRVQPAAAAAAAMPINLSAEDFAVVNRILAVVLVIIASVTVYYLINKRPRVADITRRVADIPFRRPKKPIEALKPLSFYLDWTRKRDILHPAAEPKKEETLRPPKVPKKRLAELASSLKLQGISWGEAPKAIILDESEGSRIYFLEEGKKIGATGIAIKEIKKDKVTVSYGDEEMELL